MRMPKPAASSVLVAARSSQRSPRTAQDRAGAAIVRRRHAPEFLDFLEYLGSWEGEEQDWVQFLEVEGQKSCTGGGGNEDRMRTRMMTMSCREAMRRVWSTIGVLVASGGLGVAHARGRGVGRVERRSAGAPAAARGALGEPAARPAGSSRQRLAALGADGSRPARRGAQERFKTWRGLPAGEAQGDPRQFDRYQKMSPEQKAEAAQDLRSRARDVARAAHASCATAGSG